MAEQFIKRQDIKIAYYEAWLKKMPTDKADMDVPLSKVFEITQNIPAADVVEVVRHGGWKKSYADHEAFGVRPFFRYCSECHEATVYPYNYCPNCGARMEVQDAT